MYFSDIDECQSQDLCTNGKCINYAGGYECSCDPGFEPSSDMRHCIGKHFMTADIKRHLIKKVCEQIDEEFGEE